MKKVLSFVLVLTLVLGSFSVAFAAAPVDVQGTDYETAVTALTELGVVNGYEDGTYKPDQTVTRAEAAKLIISALGLTDYAGANTATFTDLDGYAWAAGYIGYAQSLGLLKGDGNGKFRPGDTVSYQEMATILVRALGWTDEVLQGTWPANYIVRAKALGIMDGVAKAGNTAATRGDVALMIYNNLDNKIGYITKDNQWVAYGATVNGVTQGQTDSMLIRLSKDVLKGADGKAIKFVLTDKGYNNNTVRIADDVNLTAYYGMYVTAFLNNDGDIAGIKSVESKLLEGKFATGSQLKFVADGVKYDVSDTNENVVLLNGRYNSTLAAITTAPDTTTTYAIAVDLSGKKIKEIYSVNVWNGTNVIWKTSDTNKLEKNLKIRSFEFNENNNKGIDTDTFTLVGVSSLDKIAEGDVVTVYTNGKITKVEVSNDVVEGKVTKEAKDSDGSSYYVINGKNYYTATSVDGDISDVKLGAEGKFFLNYAGDIVDFDGITKADNYAVVVKAAGTNTVTGAYESDTTYQIKLLTADGKATVYTIDEDTVVTGAAATIGYISESAVRTALAERVLVAYHLNSKGEIDTLEIPHQYDADDGQYTAKGFFDGIELASNAVIFSDATDADDIEIGTVSNLKVNEDFGPTTKYVLDNKGEKVVAILIGTADSNTTNPYGVVVDYGKVENADGDTVYEVKMLVDGKEVTYLTEDVTGTYNFTTVNPTTGEKVGQKDVMMLSLDGEVISAATLTTTAITATVAGVKNNSIKLEGGAYLELSDDVVVYELILDANNQFDTWEVSDLSSITTDIDWVDLIDTDTSKGHEGYEIVLFIAN